MIDVEDRTVDHVVEGTITHRVAGGLQVRLTDGRTAYLSGSQVDARPVSNLDVYIGQRHRFRIIKLGKDGNMVVSRRILLEEG